MTSSNIHYQIRNSVCIFSLAITLILPTLNSSFAVPSTTNNTEGPSVFLIDQTLFSINGEVATLRDFLTFTGRHSIQDLNEIRTDSSLANAYKAFVFSKILTNEAQNMGVPVREQDFQTYLQEVAKQNNLTVDEFKRRVAAEGQEFDSYKAQISAEIARAKIFGKLLNASVPISEKEVTEYLDARTGLVGNGEVVFLRALTISDSEDVTSMQNRIVNELQNSGVSFRELVREFSEDENVNMGGIIGILPLEDLSADIADAIFELPENRTSEWIDRGNKWTLYFVDSRMEPDSIDNEKLRASVQSLLSEQKRQIQAQEFFGETLLTKYKVQEFF